jgi:hypothetical protein
VSEARGVEIQWLCESPSYLGVPYNAVDWLVKGITALVGKKLDMPVTELPTARGQDVEDDESSEKQ